MSVGELLATLAAIEATVLVYPSTRGRPKARRILTEMTSTQHQLYNLFGLHCCPTRSMRMVAAAREAGVIINDRRRRGR